MCTRPSAAPLPALPPPAAALSVVATEMAPSEAALAVALSGVDSALAIAWLGEGSGDASCSPGSTSCGGGGGTCFACPGLSGALEASGCTA